LSQGKLFTFNASSFRLDPSVEGFLKSKGAISLDFGVFAYVNSEAMPSVLSELVKKVNTGASSNADLVAQLKAEVGKYFAERQKMIEDNTRLASHVDTYSAQISALEDQAANAATLIETLKAENARLQSALKNAPAAQSMQPAAGNDDKMRQSYERLKMDMQALRAQSAESLASLKVLEEENEELMIELEKLRSQSRNAAAPKAS
jgi:regulator of replication initiation timing